MDNAHRLLIRQQLTPNLVQYYGHCGCRVDAIHRLGHRNVYHRSSARAFSESVKEGLLNLLFFVNWRLLTHRLPD